MKRSAWIVIFLLLLFPLQPIAFAQPAAAAANLRYLSPPDGGKFIRPASTVALRLDGPIDPQSLSATLFNIVGSASGWHPGQVVLAADGATVVFQPSSPFAAGEHVTVTIGPGLRTKAGATFHGQQSSFNIAQQTVDWRAIQADLPEGAPLALPNPSLTTAPAVPSGHPQDYVTFPDDFPAYTVTVPASGTAPGLLFMAPIPLANTGRSFEFITDDTGEPVFWQAVDSTSRIFDFKQQPDGTLSYYEYPAARFHILDNSYRETRVFTAANGYTADIHDLQILPNGNALFMIADAETVDTTKIITSGGYTTATVVGYLIQELDPNGLPVFQWSSWDHFLITDTYTPIDTPLVDYVHGNAVALANDGNLLFSSRHMSEITKIDHNTGAIIWRLGGKNNMFTFTNDPDGPFNFQHDIRQLPNGDLTIFDNHNPAGPSRAVEYQIDETARVVTNTWQFRNTPDEFGPFTGNNQSLPDGHRLIDWGYAYPNVTEVLADGTKLFEFQMEPGYFSYRAFRFPWAAVPAWSPTLVLTGTTPPILYYSWNGATDVASYNIYGGLGQAPNTLLGNQPRTGFEDHTSLVGMPAGDCAFRVQPIDHEGQPQRFSNTVYTRPDCPALFFPGVFR